METVTIKDLKKHENEEVKLMVGFIIEEALVRSGF